MFRKKRATHGAARRNTLWFGAIERVHKTTQMQLVENILKLNLYFFMTEQIGLSRGTQILKVNCIVTKLFLENNKLFGKFIN